MSSTANALRRLRLKPLRVATSESSPRHAIIDTIDNTVIATNSSSNVKPRAMELFIYWLVGITVISSAS